MYYRYEMLVVSQMTKHVVEMLVKLVVDDISYQSVCSTST